MSSEPAPIPRSVFTARRLTPSTFLIVEDDIHHERPYIYAKLIPDARTLLLVDTGCGGASKAPEDVDLTSLREFLETVPIADNAGAPLNADARLRYVVVLTHCHFDHILGVEAFSQDSQIVVSGFDPSFISPDNLPHNSLCEWLELRTPSYQPSLKPDQHSLLSADGEPLGVTLLHTPGHTPDELALWDASEAMLYVGDTLYEEGDHIIFPNEGDVVAWLASVDGLIALIEGSGAKAQARVNSGHCTAARPALEVLESAKAFIVDVIEGREKEKRRMTRRDEVNVEYIQEGGRYSLWCPERLLEEARNKGQR